MAKQDMREGSRDLGWLNRMEGEEAEISDGGTGCDKRQNRSVITEQDMRRSSRDQ